MNPQQQPQMMMPNQPMQGGQPGQPMQPMQSMQQPQVIMPGQQMPMQQVPVQQQMPVQQVANGQMAQNPNAAAMGSAAMQAQAAAPIPPNKEVPTSTQATLMISELRDNVVIMKDGSFRAVVACKSINFDLMSDMEREGVGYSYQNFLNSLKRKSRYNHD